MALKRIPSGARAQRIAELSSISERLLRVMDPEHIPVWMNKPAPALDDRKPIELISGGEYLRVAGGFVSVDQRHHVLHSRPRGSVIPESCVSHVTLAERAPTPG